MATYSWVTAGWGPTGLTAPNVNLPLLDLTIPAGAEIVRYQFRGTAVQGFKTAFTWSSIGVWALNIKVAFVGGTYAGRQILYTIRDIPYSVTAYTELGVANYVQFLHGGDNEFGFNQKCNYGRKTSPASTLRLTCFGMSNTSSVSCAVYGQFAALYRV